MVKENFLKLPSEALSFFILCEKNSDTALFLFTKKSMCFRGVFIRKQRKPKSLSWQRILAFLFFLFCFLLKTAIAIPLKILKGNCFREHAVLYFAFLFLFLKLLSQNCGLLISRWLLHAVHLYWCKLPDSPVLQSRVRQCRMCCQPECCP